MKNQLLFKKVSQSFLFRNDRVFFLIEQISQSYLLRNDKNVGD